MRYRQVRDMLDHVRDFHRQLAAYYGQLVDKTTAQRVKMLLDYMAKHEESLQQGMAAYEEGASRQVMDTYMDCEYCHEILTTCEQTPIVPEMSVDGVVQVALDVDNCLLRFYRAVAEKAETKTVRDVFNNLAEMQQAELRKLALNALHARDV